jgi:hypothetical protein
VRKVISEILKLMWKVFRLVIWKWIKPILGKVILAGFVFIAVITAVALLIAGSCSGG